jgi:hypothetical protein
VIDEIEPEADSDMRRRAAWLLGTLAIVAVLLVIILTTVVGTSDGKKDGSQPGPLDSAIGSSIPRSSPSSTAHPTGHSTGSTSTGSSTSNQASTTPPAGSTSCPTAQTCVLTGDVGSGGNAINAYRTQHGQPAVQVSVGQQAQTCAQHNGSGCSGGWAETELPKADGTEAVQKILPFAHLLDSSVKTIQIGWAYDPGAKLYYFAIIRND